MRAFVVLIDMSKPYVTSPNLPTDRDVVGTAKGFVNATTTELNDDEAKKFLEITIGIVKKHQTIWKRLFPFDSLEQCVGLLDRLEQELTYTMMVEMNIMVRVDGTPIFAGGAPVIEFLGKTEGTPFAIYGMDHEKKEAEVRKAKDRGEDYLGQKDNYRSR